MFINNLQNLKNFGNQLKRINTIYNTYGFRSVRTTVGEFILYRYGNLLMHQYNKNSLTIDTHSTELIRISPSNITYFQPSMFDRFVEGFQQMGVSNPIIGGYWDLLRISYDDRIFHRSLEDHFLNDVSWEDTIFIQQCLDDIANNTVTWHGCRTKEDIFNRCNEVDDLYHSIKTTGYKSHKELGNSIEDEVKVNVGRNGSLIQAGGKHRLSIAKILELPEIPVKVFIRHKKSKNTTSL